MQIKYTFITALLASLLCGGQLLAQEQVSIYVPDTVFTVGEQTNVCIPVVADSFPSIAAMQFSFVWDAEVLSFTGLELGDNPLDFTSGTTFTPTDSTLGVSWLSSSPSGVTLAFGTTMFSLCFDVGNMEGSSVISFDSYLAGEFIQAGAVTEFPFSFADGSVNLVAPPPVIAILPGDTNRDSLVNAEDLLNIGLAFGSNGPARDNPMTDFSIQSATPWDILTPVSGLDFANIDANGDGMIGNGDQAVMEANFGESLTNSPLPESNTSGVVQNPFIYFDLPDDITAGVETTIDVMVGNTDFPVAEGYGLAFGIFMSATQIEPSTVSVDFSESYLGDDLLTFAGFYPNEPELLEIALSRKDQQNSTAAGGKVCSITFTPNFSEMPYEIAFFTTPYRLIDKDENETILVDVINQVDVAGVSSVREPAWAAELSVAPNPVQTNGIITLGTGNISLDRLVITDLSGRVLHSVARPTSQVNVGNLPAGTYLLRMFAGSEAVVRKLVVE